MKLKSITLLKKQSKINIFFEWDATCIHFVFHCKRCKNFYSTFEIET